MERDTVRALVIAGGGIRGNIPSVILWHILQSIRLNTKNLDLGYKDILDFAAGSSVGGIIAAPLICGIPISDINKALRDKDIWQRRYAPWTPKWKREPILDRLSKVLTDNKVRNGADITFGDIDDMYNGSKLLMVTTVNKNRKYPAAENMFFKSWQQRWRHFKVMDAVAATFAASYYFGNINNDQLQKVLADGGEGNQNSPIAQAMGSINRRIRKVRPGADIRLLYIGTGFYTEYRSYKKASRMGMVREAANVPMMAMEQAWETQSYLAMTQAEIDPRFGFKMINPPLPNKELSSLDRIKDISKYVSIGDEVGKEVAEDVAQFWGYK